MKTWFRTIYNKFLNAFRGIYIIIKEEKSLWFHLLVSVLVIVFGLVFGLNNVEWAILSIAIGLVIGFEIINTGLEYVVDIVSFEYSVKAKKVKDVGAAATLWMTFISIILGLLIFIPAIIRFVEKL